MPAITAQPPRLLRFQDVRFDLKRLFLKMTECATRASVAYGTGDWKGAVAGLITSAFGAAEAISVETPPDVLAWKLIRGGLTRAISELMSELSPARRPYLGDQEYLDQQIEATIGQSEAQIDQEFFANPAALPLLTAIRPLFAYWLRFCDLEEVEAAAMARRLPSYVAVGLHEEWRAGEDRYEPLLQALNSPLAQAARWEQQWQRYRQTLIKQFDKPVFEERFALSAIYVPLRAARRETVRERLDWAPEAVPLRDGHASAEGSKAQAVVTNLETAIWEWLKKADPNDSTRIIRGGPGSGKSTSAKRLAAELAAHDTMRVLFFPLQHFRISGKLIDAIGEALGEHGVQAFQENPLQQPSFATRDRPLLLIFDGLDELAQPGRDADKQTREFLTEVRFFVDRWNAEYCRVFCLITGRSPVVQAHRDVLRRKEDQELEVLPLHVSEEAIEAREREGCLFHDPEALLKCDQRELWWQRFAACKAGEPAEIPAVLKDEDVHDLSSEPLLLYLLVLSGYHRRTDTTEPVNRNRIYADLFADVGNRRHAGSDALSARRELQESFDEVMETIATAAWYGDGRAASIEDIRRVCPEHLREVLERFFVNETGVARLIAAFYFQKSEDGVRRRDAIEFTHKSFGEYLTARRLVRTIREIHGELSTRHRRRYGELQALAEWFELTCHTAMDPDLLRFLRDEVALHEREAEPWQDMLCRLLNLSMRDGMPVSMASEVTFRAAEQKARNAEEALLAALNACARVSGRISKPDWDNSLEAGSLIKRLKNRNIKSISRQCFSHTEFCNQYFIGDDFLSADLSRSDFRGSSLVFGVFATARLIGVDFSGADLEGANLTGANLTGADLTGADLRSADFRSANLLDATLRSADLTDANLRSANLKTADLTGANLLGATLRSADLTDANFLGADLRSADLTGVNLASADLEGANLLGANLTGANLTGANLRSAYLMGAHLADADLTSADLTGANLRSANLTSADLTGANLASADLTSANLAGADLTSADLTGADLTAVIGFP